MTVSFILSGLTAKDFAHEATDTELSKACLMPIMWHASILQETLPPKALGDFRPYLVYIPILFVFPIMYGAIIYLGSGFAQKILKPNKASAANSLHATRSTLG